MEALWLPSRARWLWLGSSPCPAPHPTITPAPGLQPTLLVPLPWGNKEGLSCWDTGTLRQAVSLPPPSVTLGHVLEDLPMASACSGKPFPSHIWVMVVFSYPWQGRHKSCTASSSQLNISNLACADNHLLVPSPLAVPPPLSLTFSCLHTTASCSPKPWFPSLSPMSSPLGRAAPTQYQGLQAQQRSAQHSLAVTCGLRAGMLHHSRTANLCVRKWWWCSDTKLSHPSCNSLLELVRIHFLITVHHLLLFIFLTVKCPFLQNAKPLSRLQNFLSFPSELK